MHNRLTIKPVATTSSNASWPSVALDESSSLVIFGGTGDLTKRKLMPALFSMYLRGLLRKHLRIYALGRSDYSDEGYRTLIQSGMENYAGQAFAAADLDLFLQQVYYVQGNLTEISCYTNLKKRLNDGTLRHPNLLFYLAIRPDFFKPVVSSLSGADLISPPHLRPWTRVVFEKPFGENLSSAARLNQEILRYLDESQIYRIDHYLGKETVQNILSFRFANAIFEPLFNNHYIDHVQITAAETVGMESGRGGYYDRSGALRDMVQNHLLQLLCLVCMEPPSGLDAAAVHNEKVKVLRSVIPVKHDDVVQSVVRGQYSRGTLDGKPVTAYLDEDQVSPSSKTPTFVALKLNVENWRWAGVPFFIRTGKRLAKRVTEISIQFKQCALQLFRTVECEGDVCDITRAKPNVLAFRIQPNEGISLRFSAKRPEMQFVVEGVDMSFSYAETWQKISSEGLRAFAAGSSSRRLYSVYPVG